MIRHGRHGWLYVAFKVGLALAAAHYASIIRAADDSNTAPLWRAMQEDAELCDVCFVDEQNGWTVGDRGTIWHTADGGATWQLQATPVHCRLTGVSFVDTLRGWAVGAESMPVVGGTQGVLLRTLDGGATWQVDRPVLFSLPQRVRFFDALRGVVYGAPSALQPSGISTSEDGGRSWSPVPGAADVPWLGGDFADPLNGILVGDSATTGLLRRRELESNVRTGLGLRRLRQVQLVPPAAAWLVGDGGLVQFSQDLGRTWLTPLGDPVAVSGEGFDWQGLAVRGNKVWVCGNPGTKVLHSTDGGRSWQTAATGSLAPLSALQFVDDQQGWAVGALGTVLHTADGGRTWQRQHAGGVRAALLALVAEPDDLPFELLTRLAGNEGYLAAAHFLVRRDLEPGDAQRHSIDARAAAAMSLVGGSVAERAWQFPLRQRGLAPTAEQILESWNLVHDGHGLEQLEAHLVRQIRTWRPDLIVTHAADPRGNDPLGHLINQLVLRAVEQAADATAWPQQGIQAGLEPWRVKKVIGALGEGRMGVLSVPASQFAAHYGTTVGDLADEARALLGQAATGGTTAGFQLLIDPLAQGGGGADFMSGIVLQPGGEARRLLPPSPDQAVDAMRRVAQQRRNLQAILTQETEAGVTGEKLVSHVNTLTHGLDDASTGNFLAQLADRYAQQGRWNSAAEMHQLLVARAPQHRLAPASLVWLLRYWSSGEIAWQIERSEQRTALHPAAPAAMMIDAGRAGAQRIPAAIPNVPTERRAGFVKDTPNESSRAQRAAAAAQQLERLAPRLFTEPDVQFPLAAAHRNQGLTRQSDRYFLGFSRTRGHDAWWACSMGEHWLNEPKGECPKPAIHAAVASLKPRLDGKLDDAMWKHARAERLTSLHDDDEDWPAQVQLAYDNEYLFVGVRCTSAGAQRATASTGARPRDPDLSAHDRVELLIDIDRDYATFYRLVIDRRGWVADSLWGAKSWDPDWFVAAASDDDGAWTAEAAIPWSALVGRRPESRYVWALGVQRTVPGVGFQSWTTPASTSILPEGFGYLIFE